MSTTSELLSIVDRLSGSIQFIEECLENDNIAALSSENEYNVWAGDREGAYELRDHLYEELDEFITQLYQKGENIVGFLTEIKAKVEECDARVKVYKEAIDGYNKTLRRHERTMEFLKNYCIMGIVKRFGHDDAKGRLLEINGRKCRIMKSESVNIDPDIDISKLPEEFIKVTYEPRKSDIKEAIKKGKEFGDGIYIKIKEFIRVF